MYDVLMIEDHQHRNSSCAPLFRVSITKLTTTQLPFPLVQMTRTFLLFYIFTVPLALLSDVSSPYMHLVVIFFLTFGYIGLEVVSVELDDPFGGKSRNTRDK